MSTSLQRALQQGPNPNNGKNFSQRSIQSTGNGKNSSQRQLQNSGKNSRQKSPPSDNGRQSSQRSVQSNGGHKGQQSKNGRNKRASQGNNNKRNNNNSSSSNNNTRQPHYHKNHSYSIETLSNEGQGDKLNKEAADFVPSQAAESRDAQLLVQAQEEIARLQAENSAQVEARQKMEAETLKRQTQQETAQALLEEELKASREAEVDLRKSVEFRQAELSALQDSFRFETEALKRSEEEARMLLEAEQESLQRAERELEELQEAAQQVILRRQVATEEHAEKIAEYEVMKLNEQLHASQEIASELRQWAVDGEAELRAVKEAYEAKLKAATETAAKAEDLLAKSQQEVTQLTADKKKMKASESQRKILEKELRTLRDTENGLREELQQVKTEMSELREKSEKEIKMLRDLEAKESKLLGEARDEITKLKSATTSREEDSTTRAKLEEELKILRAAELNWKKEAECNEAQWTQRTVQLESELKKVTQTETNHTKLLLEAQEEIASLWNQNNALARAKTKAETEAREHKQQEEMERQKLEGQLSVHRESEARLRRIAEQGEADMRRLLAKYKAETDFLKSSEMALKQQLAEERAKSRDLRSQNSSTPQAAVSVQRQTLEQKSESYPASKKGNDNAVAKHGWFEKQGEQLSFMWQKRYFVLFQNGKLMYYPDEESAFDGKVMGKTLPVQSWKLNSDRAIYGQRFISLDCKGRQSNLKIRPCSDKNSGAFVDDLTSWVRIGNSCLRSLGILSIESTGEDPMYC